MRYYTALCCTLEGFPISLATRSISSEMHRTLPASAFLHTDFTETCPGCGSGLFRNWSSLCSAEADVTNRCLLTQQQSSDPLVFIPILWKVN